MERKFDFDEKLYPRFDFPSNTTTIWKNSRFLRLLVMRRRRNTTHRSWWTYFKNLSEANLLNYSHVVPSVSNGDHYVEIADGDGNRKLFKNYCGLVFWSGTWMNIKQSNDRSIRVRKQATVPRSNSYRNECVQRGTIRPGDWCIFRDDEGRLSTWKYYFFR